MYVVIILCPNVRWIQAKGVRKRISKIILFLPLPVSYTHLKPKDEGDKLLFKLSCPILNRYVKDAIKSETDSIKSELTNYLLLAGTQE